MTLETLLSGLSRDEKLAAMDFLWEDLSREPAEIVSPPWHGQVIADRLANSTDSPALSLEASKAEVLEGLNLHRTKSFRI